MHTHSHFLGEAVAHVPAPAREQPEIASRTMNALRPCDLTAHLYSERRVIFCGARAVINPDLLTSRPRTERPESAGEVLKWFSVNGPHRQVSVRLRLHLAFHACTPAGITQQVYDSRICASFGGDIGAQHRRCESRACHPNRRTRLHIFHRMRY